MSEEVNMCPPLDFSHASGLFVVYFVISIALNSPLVLSMRGFKIWFYILTFSLIPMILPSLIATTCMIWSLALCGWFYCHYQWGKTLSLPRVWNERFGPSLVLFYHWDCLLLHGVYFISSFSKYAQNILHRAHLTDKRLLIPLLS